MTAAEYVREARALDAAERPADPTHVDSILCEVFAEESWCQAAVAVLAWLLAD